MRRTLLSAGLLLALVLVGCRGRSTSTPPPDDGTPPGDQIVTGEAAVESVDVLILESFPVQVQIEATGNLPDSCTALLPPQVERNGSTFVVTLTTQTNLTGPCTQALMPFTQTITLDVAGLSAGDYTVNVNGIEASFTLSVDNVLPEGETAMPPTPAPPDRGSGGQPGQGEGTLYISSAEVKGKVVTIRGSLADACTSLGQILEERDGSTIRLTVKATRPPDAMCAQVLVDFETTYTLTSAIEPGMYTLIVNDTVKVEFTIE